jgi:hypothetical protein
MPKKSKKEDKKENTDSKPKVEIPKLKITQLPSNIKIIEKKKDESLEQEVEEAEAEHFSQFVPSQSSSVSAPIIRPSQSSQQQTQSQAVEVPLELTAGERAQKEHDRNKMTSGASSSDPSLARLYDIGKSLGGNAVRRYETGETPIVPTLRPDLNQPSGFARQSAGFENPELSAARRTDNEEVKYYSPTGGQSLVEKKRRPWEHSGEVSF